MTSTEEFWIRTLSTVARLEEMTYYELLDVEPTAGGVTLSEAYYALVRQMHPDRHTRESSLTRQQALVRIYARLTEAYRVLSNSDKRAAYDAILEQGGKRLGPEQRSTRRRLGDRHDPKTARARVLYERGRSLLDARQHAAAKAQLELALAYEPDSRAIRRALDQVKEPVRAHKRFTAKEPVAVRCETWQQLEQLYTSDISRGGMFIQSAEELPIGTELSLELMTPDDRRIKLKAEVRRWVPADAADGTGPGLGVRFIELTSEKRSEISRIIRLNRPPPEEPEPEPDFELPEPEHGDDEPEDEVAPGREQPTRARPPPLPTRLEVDDLFDEDTFVGLTSSGAQELAIEDASGARDAASALRRGQYLEARDMFARAVKGRPDDRTLQSSYHLACGHLARENGRTEDARKHFERALALDRTCHDAAYELRKLGRS